VIDFDKTHPHFLTRKQAVTIVFFAPRDKIYVLQVVYYVGQSEFETIVSLQNIYGQGVNAIFHRTTLRLEEYLSK